MSRATGFIATTLNLWRFWRHIFFMSVSSLLSQINTQNLSWEEDLGEVRVNGPAWWTGTALYGVQLITLRNVVGYNVPATLRSKATSKRQVKPVCAQPFLSCQRFSQCRVSDSFCTGLTESGWPAVECGCKQNVTVFGLHGKQTKCNCFLLAPY